MAPGLVRVVALQFTIPASGGVVTEVANLAEDAAEDAVSAAHRGSAQLGSKNSPGTIANFKAVV